MLNFSRYRWLSFDCYGTLIDWETGILNALQPVLRAHGAQLPDEQLLEWYGHLEPMAQEGKFRSYREVLREVMRGLAERLGFAPEPGQAEVLAHSLPDWPPFPDTGSALQALKGRYRLAVLSNIDDDLFAGSARQLVVEFDEAVTALQVRSYKPAPRHWQVALERFGVGTDQVLHVAQSLYHDIAPARALGFGTVWVNRRHGKPGSGATYPTEAMPDLEVPDLRTLANMVQD